MNFDNISNWIIAKNVLAETIKAVQLNGKKGYELFVFWTGKQINQNTFEVSELIIPKQKGFKSPLGAWVEIPGEELNRINMYLYERKLSMPIQVHSHPGRAYHSQRDNEKSVLIFPGSISMVIPNFGNKAFHSFSDWAVYRLSKNNGWQAISTKEISTHFAIRE